jgi:CDP-glycerol glycerophosphotransferase (TagB/SpsB family)
MVLASDPDACQFFRQQGIAYRRLGHFVTPSIWRRYQANRRWPRKHQKELAVRVEREILNENIALLPFVQSDLSRLLRHHLARLRLYTDVYLELFQHSQPGHVVVADDTTTQGRIAVLAAQSLSIPTLNIQHGAIADVQHYRYAIADVFAVWGERDRELLVRHGVPQEKTVITGQPRFDDLGRQTNNTAHLRQRLGFPASHKLILWATTPFVPRVSYDFPDRNRRYLQALLELLTRELSWNLVIKLHPRDQRAYYETALAEVESSVRSRVCVLQEEDIQQLLLIADVLLAWNTSVIQEAVLAKKPIIGLNFFAFPEAISSVSEGVALPARDAEELSQALRGVFANDESTLAAMVEARQKYIARHLKADERTAVERIIELIGAKTVQNLSNVDKPEPKAKMIRDRIIKDMSCRRHLFQHEHRAQYVKRTFQDDIVMLLARIKPHANKNHCKNPTGLIRWVFLSVGDLFSL